MSDPKNSTQQTETTAPGKTQQDELSERDLAKAAGGGKTFDDESPKE